jgi:co-chaperonin GroES (HSP10)
MALVNEFESYLPYEIDLQKFSLVEGTNQVLVKVYEQDVKETVGGIITEGIKSFEFAQNTERRGKVVKTVKTIIPGQNGVNVMMHDCDLEIQEGDEVYFNYFDNINSFIYTCQGEVYKLIPYSAIILAIRGENVIMCNGYLLIERIKREDRLLPEYKNDEGIVCFHGSLNKKYFMVVPYKDLDRYMEDNPDKKVYSQLNHGVLINHLKRTDKGTEKIKKGSCVVIGDGRWLFDLEVYAYARFDNRKVYTVCPRHCVIGIIE